MTRETPHVTPRVTTYTREIQFYILVFEVNNQKYLFMRRPCLRLKRINLDGWKLVLLTPEADDGGAPATLICVASQDE